MSLIGGASMEFSRVEAIVQEHVQLIKLSPDSFKEPLDRSTKFLVVMALLADCRRALEGDKAKLETIVQALFTEAVTRSMGKNITEKKIEAEANEDYNQAKMSLSENESMITWCRTYSDIFEHAHLTYRMMAKEHG